MTQVLELHFILAPLFLAPHIESCIILFHSIKLTLASLQQVSLDLQSLLAPLPGSFEIRNVVLFFLDCFFSSEYVCSQLYLFYLKFLKSLLILFLSLLFSLNFILKLLNSRNAAFLPCLSFSFTFCQGFLKWMNSLGPILLLIIMLIQ